VDSYARITDITPTLLTLIGAESHVSDDMVGTSLLPLINGAGADRNLYTEGMLYGTTERALIDGGYKLMYDEQGPQYRLYDVRSDHPEQDDLADEQPERVAEMSAVLDEIHHRSQAYYSTRFPGAADSLVSAEERERIRRAMQALGYIND
jgi:arylsulfatase A-like enzyme